MLILPPNWNRTISIFYEYQKYAEAQKKQKVTINGYNKYLKYLGR